MAREMSVIVTGAASGIGLAVAKKFAQEGAKVMMADVNKASDMILDAVDRQKLALGETPILDKNKGHMEDKAQIVSFEDAAIIKKKNGEYAVRASYQGMELGMKPIDKETGVRYFLMPEGKEKEKLLTETLSSKYAHDVSNIMNSANRNLKIG